MNGDSAMAIDGYGHGVTSRWWNRGGRGIGFRSMDEVRRANSEAGFHFFSRGALRWFGSRVSEELYGGRYFVTSECDPHGRVWDGKRRYTVREALPDGSTTDVGGFGQYASRSGAHAAAKRAAETPKEIGWGAEYRNHPDATQRLTAGERVTDINGRPGVVFTDGAGGFVRVLFDGDTDDVLMEYGAVIRDYDRR